MRDALFADWSAEDFRVAEGIFGVREPAAIERLVVGWCATELREPCVEIVRLHLSVGASLGLAFGDGRLVVLKAFPGETDRVVLSRQAELQDRLADSDFPAPKILCGVRPFGAGHAIVMNWAAPGVLTDVRRPSMRDGMARGLARLVAEGSRLAGIDALPGALPLTHLWPPPHSAYFDFEATAAGAAWIDEIAANALDRLRQSRNGKGLGHMDWSAKNMRSFECGDVAIVYDWDSLRFERETVVVGMAAATFPCTWDLPVPRFPSEAERKAFVLAYEQARGQTFTATEGGEIDAAGLYNLAYIARCEHCGNPNNHGAPGSAREILARGRIGAARPLG